MESKLKGNIVMFFVGIAMVVVAAIMLLGGYLVESNFPIILGGMGIIFIGVSNVVYYLGVKAKK
jgi:hypothetical protein